MTIFYAYKNRGVSKDITILDADGATITPTASDIITATIFHEGGATQLSVASTAATVNGSSFTKGATNRLRLDASDLDFAAGVYTLEIKLTDASDTDEPKNVDRQVFVLEDT